MRQSTLAEQLGEQAAAATELANRNYHAWVQVKNRVQVLEKSLESAKSDKVGVAVISAALGGLAAAMMATPAVTGKRGSRS